ncbi:SurA N-terminal domain-containing protein [Candidatus Giovannonibacteria bacterium]|nr:SurA N-terminal domain-containing protein [Candidatus Giovannonibacteria bacterium]
MENNKPRKFSINIKTAVIIVAIVFAGGLLYYYKGMFVAAMVNGSPITRLELMHELEAQSGKAALESLITEKLINNEAAKKGISVSNGEIDEIIKNIEEQLKPQNITFEQALEQRNLTLDKFKSQVTVQKKLEKLVGDKIQVTDEDVEKYIAENKISIPKGQEADFATQIKEQLKGQKMNDAIGALIDSLRNQTTVRYFVKF